jgi:hypothetical protein
MEFLYRFRSIDALIGKHAELQNQEIYFASTEQLNDPMEGFKDIFWKGDKIVWKNLFKHYILCLIQTTFIVLISGKEYKSELADSLIFHSESTLPAAPIRDIVTEIYDECFGSRDVENLIEFLAARKHLIRREEFLFFITLLNTRAFPTVLSVLSRRKQMPALEMPLDGPKAPDIDAIIAQFSKLADEPGTPSEDALAALFIASDRTNQQIRLINFIRQSEQSRSGWWSLCSEFPDQYVARLNRLIHVDWYAACFVSTPDQAAMWGNYADGHKGCCLKFRVRKHDGDVPYLPLIRIIGISGGPNGTQPIVGDAMHPFLEVKYVNKFVEIDFFRSIGISRLTVPTLRKDWYSDEHGTESECADEIFSNENDWLSHYWRRFESTVTSKLEDWRHENEYRLILHSVMNEFEAHDKRKIKYKFSDLEGIIFGVATSLEDKRRIANIIEQVCKAHGRKEFEFSQAYYSARSGRIEVHPLTLLKFE